MAAGFLSTFDRYAIGPLLVTMAGDLHVRLAAVGMVAGGYALAYGLTQPLWGLLSDRYGRVRVMMAALIAAVLAGIASSLAPTLPLLILTRVLTGGFFGAVIPLALTYIGDTVPMATRQRALSDQMFAQGIATALATVCAGTLADLGGWRVVFALPPLVAVPIVLALRRLPEPPRPEGRTAPWLVLRNRWLLLAMALGFVEGAILLGGLPFLAPALEHGGVGAALAGMAMASFGIGLIVFTRVVRRLTVRVPAWGLMALGGTMMAAAFAVAAGWQSVVPILLTGFLLGGGYSFLHTSLQAWATSAAPGARGSAVAMFATSLFMGASAGTALGGAAAEAGAYGLLFGAAAIITVPLTLVAVAGRRRFIPQD
ncbi:MAG: MFS transporter [Streptosporangiales bacterium]|nr:MFS transporter [Streptosporangiales bacterium]